MKLSLIIFLLLIIFNAIILDKALGMLSYKELKRRARGTGNNRAASIYRMAAYEKSLSVLLWLKGAGAAAILAVILVHSSILAAIIFLAVTAWAVRVWQPAANTNGWLWGWASFVAPLVAFVMNYLRTLLNQVGRLTRDTVPKNHNVYEKEDLTELLHDQAKQSENRIPEEDLKIAANALGFGDKGVSQIMTPLRKVKLVGDTEQVGPLLMDELHASGFSRFPVTAAGSDAARPEIIGTLYIRDLIHHTSSANVSQLMDKKVYYVNEAASLRDALNAFLKTHHHLFVVVNNFEEIVGVLSIEDVLEQILGKQIVDEFDKYDDLRAVAAKEAEKEHAKPHHIETVDEPAEIEPEEPEE
jgi:CBS domain containing-hemolysin-like protein